MKTFHKTSFTLIQLLILLLSINLTIENKIKKTINIISKFRLLGDGYDTTTIDESETESEMESETESETEIETENKTEESMTTSITIPEESSNATSTSTPEESLNETSSSTQEESLILTSIPEESHNATIIYRKSSSGLSTGAICGIVIPSVAALIGITAAVAFLKGGSKSVPAITSTIQPTGNIIDNSLANFNAFQKMPIQKPVEIIQPQPQPQPHIIEQQPIQEIIRPNYPVNKIDPPIVNKTFKPVYHQQNIGQQIEMVPVQEVEMVPVQQVEMVPTHEVVPVKHVEMIPTQEVIPIQQVQMAPIHEVVPVKHIEMVPKQEVIPIQQIQMAPKHELVPVNHAVPSQNVEIDNRHEVIPVQLIGPIHPVVPIHPHPIIQIHPNVRHILPGQIPKSNL